ncbi:MAG: hypothetical protein KBG21_09870 [Ignavibacteria bacterium]|nr:hypothetical protein [Ignavibacteria bacterium]
MKKILTLFVLIFTLTILSAAGFAQDDSDKPERMLKKLATLKGNWNGSLEYLDYGDNKTKTKLPTVCEAVFNKSGNDKYLSVKFIFDEGNGRTVTGEDAWTILDEGKTFFYDSTNYIITSYYQNDDNNDIAVFVFEKEGEDNNKPCTIKQTFEMHNDSFSIIKKVKYKDSDSFFIRHEFAFQRVK